MLLALAVGWSLCSAALAAEPDAAEIKRGFAAVGGWTSEQPGLRQERLTREPSAGFLIGAALAAWTNAAADLKYRLENPSGDGDDTAAINLACAEERVAYTDLASRAAGAALSPTQVLAAAGQATSADAWLARQAGPPKRCA